MNKITEQHLKWFIEGKFKRASHMLIFCDPTDDYSDKPIYTKTLEEFTHQYQKHNYDNARYIIAVYDLKDTLRPQVFGQKHPFNCPKDFKPPVFDNSGHVIKPNINYTPKRLTVEEKQVSDINDVVIAVNKMVDNNNKNTKLLADHLQTMSKKLEKAAVRPILLMKESEQESILVPDQSDDFKDESIEINA